MARDRTWELVGVPYTSARLPGGIANAIGVLRSRGFAERLSESGVQDAGDLDLQAPSGERGPSGLLNERALERLVNETRRSIGSALGRGRMALLVGGDCPVILGALAAIRDRGSPPGLVMVDGHEDAWPPGRSETGEASDSEVAIALGQVSRLPSELDGLVPLLAPDRILMAGPRDLSEILEAGTESIRDEIAFFVDDRAISSDPDAIADQLLHSLAKQAIEAFWLHVDLDVLSSDAFAPVDYPQPGGIGWEELDRLTSTLAADPRCRGASVVIYNPDLDPDRTGAEQVMAFTTRLVQGAAIDAD